MLGIAKSNMNKTFMPSQHRHIGKLKSKLYSSNDPFSIKQNVWFKISFYIAIDSQLTHFFSIPDTPIYFNILVFSIPNLVNAKFKLIN